MERFGEQLSDQIKGVLTGNDRLSFRGSLRQLGFQQDIKTILCCHHIKYKDYDGSRRLHVKTPGRPQYPPQNQLHNGELSMPKNPPTPLKRKTAAATGSLVRFTIRQFIP